VSVLTVGDLFSGIGGFAIAAHRVGWQTRWLSEIDPYASRVLATRFPSIPNLGDVSRLVSPPTVAVLCGGFPCQDIAVCGKGVGITGQRSGLWSHFARLIGEVRPRYVVAENSPRLRSLGLGVVLDDLRSLGYDAEWHCIPAAAVGAAHQRDRIWIVAYPHGQQVEPVLTPRCFARSRTAAPAGPMDLVVSDRGPRGLWQPALAEDRAGGHAQVRSDGDALSEPNMGRMVDALPHRVDRLRCLGNAVVPDIPELIFRAIQSAVDNTSTTTYS